MEGGKVGVGKGLGDGDSLARVEDKHALKEGEGLSGGGGE